MRDGKALRFDGGAGFCRVVDVPYGNSAVVIESAKSYNEVSMIWCNSSTILVYFKETAPAAWAHCCSIGAAICMSSSKVEIP